MNKIFLILVLLFSLNLVYAQNESCVGEICLKDEAIENNCSKDLDLLLEKYNLLVDDVKNGATCDTLNSMLKDGNEKLSNNLKECNKSISPYKGYKAGFYIMSIICFICCVYMFYIIKQGTKDGQS